MKIPRVILTAILASSLLATPACAQQSNEWLVGFWTQTVDEDGKPLDETIEFREDGTVITYSASCDPLFTNTFHIHKDKVYLTAQTPKGFVSLLFIPTMDHKHLTMTSVRTANNAVYERASRTVGCVTARP